MNRRHFARPHQAKAFLQALDDAGDLKRYRLATFVGAVEYALNVSAVDALPDIEYPGGHSASGWWIMHGGGHTLSETARRRYGDDVMRNTFQS
jgi:hypothetical protein